MESNKNQWIGKLLGLTSWVGVACVLAIMVVVAADVFMRYMFNAPIAGAMEYCALIMAWVAYIAIGNTMYVGGHMQMTSFYDKYPPRFKCVANILIALCGGVLFFLVMTSSWTAFAKSYATKEMMASSRVVYYWFGKLALPVGSFFFVVSAVTLIVENIRTLSGLGKNDQNGG